MNWAALAALAELAGASVVVVTLIYVARELRENTKALRKSSAGSALAIVLEFTGDMARDNEMSQLLTQGTEGWDSLSERRAGQRLLGSAQLTKEGEHGSLSISARREYPPEQNVIWG